MSRLADTAPRSLARKAFRIVTNSGMNSGPATYWAADALVLFLSSRAAGGRLPADTAGSRSNAMNGTIVVDGDCVVATEEVDDSADGEAATIAHVCAIAVLAERVGSPM